MEKCIKNVARNQSYLDILTSSVKYTINKENIWEIFNYDIICTCHRTDFKLT